MVSRVDNRWPGGAEPASLVACAACAAAAVEVVTTLGGFEGQLAVGGYLGMRERCL
jgi:hypothetical protein